MKTNKKKRKKSAGKEEKDRDRVTQKGRDIRDGSKRNTEFKMFNCNCKPCFSICQIF